MLRPADGRLVGGVCAGLARRWGMDPWAVRALLVATLVVLPGSQLLVYPLLWVLMPADGAAVAAARYPVV
nr:PspC domain-containing protein [Kineococcus vitellinus]